MNKKSHKPFRFKHFSIYQEFAAMKIGTDGILLGAWVNCHNCKSILDIGTGTGVIALMIAQRNENASIDGIEIDDNAIISAGTVLGHGVKIGKNTLLAPGCMINGNTKIGSNCILNSGVQTLPRIVIGNDCTIGLGTSVFKNLDKKKTISNLQRIIVNDRK